MTRYYDEYASFAREQAIYDGSYTSEGYDSYECNEDMFTYKPYEDEDEEF